MPQKTSPTDLTYPLDRMTMQAIIASDLRELIGLYETGQLKATVDSRFDLSHTADAHRRIEDGVDHGKVVIAIK